MRFTPKSEEEVIKGGLLAKGNYQFEVRQAVEKKSKAGNQMMELVLCLWDKEGREYSIYDYLMDNVAYKVRHFCYATGLQDKYEAGTLHDIDCVGKSGECKIFVREDKSGQYPPRNAVADYLAPLEQKKQYPNANPETGFTDDEIPF